MKAYLIIKNVKQEVVFEGKALKLPIKEDAIKAKSLEVFRDPDPCVIHQSYVIQAMVESLLDQLPKNQTILGKDLSFDLSFIALDDVMNLTFFRKE